MPDDDPADLLQTIADLRRELAQARAERDEAVAQLTATAEVLGVLNSSPGDLARVFDAMLEKSMRLCDAAFGEMVTAEGPQVRVVAHRGVPAALAEFRGPQATATPTVGSIMARILDGEACIHTLDAKDDDFYRRGDPQRRALVDLGGFRTTLAVSLMKDREVLGAIHIYRQEVRPFTDKEIALVQNFAAQAVIAMENGRLLTETREALEQQTATAEVLGVINSSPGDLAPVFEAMLEKAVRLCDIEFGGLFTYDGDRFRARALHRFPEASRQFTEQNAPDSESAFGDLVRGERLVHIADVTAGHSSKSAYARRATELFGTRTLLLVPLRKDGALLGAISAYRREVRQFTEKQIALLQNFAAQAVIAMENARLIAETRETLEQQTATAEVLGVINSSPGDLAPVFEAILDKAMRLCGAAFGLMNTYDGERFNFAASIGVPAAYAEWRKGRPLVFHARSNPARVLSGERVVHVVDMTAGQAYADGNPNARALGDLAGARTMLTVPLLRDDSVSGIITIFRQEVRPFSDKQIALLQNFAAQAEIAMENARLLGELRERNDEIAGWNRELEARVAAQLGEIERTGKLRRFLAPQLADLIVAQADESILESHRREIVVVFCDLRGFTGFAERAEPEEVMALLRDYHAAMGPIVARFEGTIDHYGGDGIMVFFNDPLPTPDPASRAIDMAVAMRAAAQGLLRAWRRQGHDIGFGVGIAQGYATLGQIGFAERMDYTAIGTVTNLAARLCAEARDGQILVSRRVAIAVEDTLQLEEIGDVALKGLSQAVAVYNVPL